MSELMLLSNSFSSGLGALEHALATIAEIVPHGGDALFVPYASDDADTYTDAMHDVLAALDIRVIGAHRISEPLARLADRDPVFVGDGNTFRLLRAVDRHGPLTAIRQRVRIGMPYRIPAPRLAQHHAGCPPAHICPSVPTAGDPRDHHLSVLQ